MEGNAAPLSAPTSDAAASESSTGAAGFAAAQYIPPRTPSRTDSAAGVPEARFFAESAADSLGPAGMSDDEEGREAAALLSSLDGSSDQNDAQSESDRRSVYVGNVDYSVTPQELQTHFADCGKLDRITIMVDRNTGHPKGFAYIEFADEAAAENALKMTGTTLHDRPLKVTPKRKNVPRFNSRGRSFVGPYHRGGFRGRGTLRGRYGARFRGYARGRGRGHAFAPRPSAPASAGAPAVEAAAAEAH